MRLSSALIFACSFLVIRSHAAEEAAGAPSSTASGTSAATAARIENLGLADIQSIAIPLTMQIPVDHFSTNTQTFSNRYWINTAYYKPGSPVFLMDVGEQSCSDSFAHAFLTTADGPTASAVMALAKKYNGLAVLLEHRFYGQSLPLPLDPATGKAKDGWNAYQYLTVEQGLEDAIYLAEHFQPQGLEASWDILQPTKTPWIFIGGSYSGARAAWIRIRNPDVFYASWSSSAPVQTTIDMATYYEQIYIDMTANCSADYAAASQYVTDTLTSGSERDQELVTVLSNVAQSPGNVSQYTNLTDAQIADSNRGVNTSDFGVALNLANFVTGTFQTFGFSVALQPYCDAIEAFNPKHVDNSSIASVISTTFKNPKDEKPTSNGIAANHGPQAAYLGLMTGMAAEFSGSGPSTSNPTPGDTMSWSFQTCTEFGYFQVSNTSSKYNLLSSFINVTSWEQTQCKDVFPYAELPSAPNADALVKRYGGWNMNPSNVMFTDGLKDPWHTLSVQSTNSEIGAPSRSTTQNIPECNKAPDSSSVFGLTYPDGQHTRDLAGNAGPATDALKLFESAMDKWLPCFQAHSITSNTTTTSTGQVTSTTGVANAGGNNNSGGGASNGNSNGGASTTGGSGGSSGGASNTGSGGGTGPSATSSASLPKRPVLAAACTSASCNVHFGLILAALVAYLAL